VIAKAILTLAALSLTISACAQDLHKLVDLTTTSDVRGVDACGETGVVGALGRDGSITLWQLPSGEIVRKIAAQEGIRSLACSADAKWLAIGKQDGTVRIEAIAGLPIQTLNVAHGAIVNLAFSKDKSVLGVEVRGSPAQLWDTVRGTLIAALQTDFSGNGDMAFSPDGKLFATADLDTAVRIYDTSGKLKAKYAGLLLEPFTISFMPSGNELVVSGADGTLTILAASDGHRVRALPKSSDPVFFSAVLPTGNSVITVQEDATSSHQSTTLLWDLRSGTHRNLPLNGDAIKGFGVLQNHQLVVFTADSKASLGVWEVRDR
jgi:WD40 repeat protein